MYKNHLIFVINFLKIKVIEGYRIIIVLIPDWNGGAQKTPP